MKYGLNPHVITDINKIFFKNLKIQKVILYGSRAMGNFREGSDIDLVIVGDQLSTQDLLQIENELDELMLPYKIDISLWHQIENSNLLDHINRVGVDFYQR